MASAQEQKYLESQGVAVQSGQPMAGSAADMPTVGVRTLHEIPSKKKLCDAYLLGIALGWLGAHHFYLRRPGFGALYFFTFGLLGVGWIVDLFRMPCLVREANTGLEEPWQPKKKLLSDAYVCWFPLGFFGVHHFYLGRWMWGLAYLFTFGLFGIGWIIDAFRLPSIVRRVNERLAAEHAEGPPEPGKKSLGGAYVLAACPITGLLGGHHYYLGRWQFGLVYTFSLGLLGIGYLVDLFRLPFLVRDVNRKIVEGDDGKKRLDDAYLALFPMGFLGLHHFYLKRCGWGILYFFTFGLLGIGWLVDFCRLPFLVREFNKNIDEQRKRLLATTAVVSVAARGYINPTGPGAAGGPGEGPGGAPGEMVNPAAAAGVYPYLPHGGNYPGPPPEMGVNGQWGYGTTGYSSWSTIDSSEAGQPPSYQQSVDGPKAGPPPTVDVHQTAAPTAPKAD